MRGAVTIPDLSDRDDATEMFIPANCKGWVTGNRGSELRRMENETGVYMFMALDGRGEERLIIFSCDAGSKVSPKGRMAAERLVNEMVQEKLRDDDRGRSGSRGRSRSRSPRRDSRQRSAPARSPPRRSPPRQSPRRSPPRRSPPRRSPPRRSPPRRDSRRRSPPPRQRSPSRRRSPPRGGSRDRGGGGGGGRDYGRR